jgi:AcrR family transcriptional regulator
MPRALGEEARQATHTRILREAASEFAQLGFEQANINTIAERAGIGKGTIYLYFPSKRDLFISMLQAIAQRQLSEARAALQSGKTIQEQLQALFLAFVRLATEDADGFHVYMSALYGVNRAFQDEAVGLLREYVTLIRETLAHHAAARNVSLADIDASALFILSATESFVLSARVLGYSERRLAELAPHIAELAMRGLEYPGLFTP